MMNVATAVTDQLLRRLGYFSLPGHGRVYNLKPIEVDAHAAASRLIRSQLGDAAVDELAMQVDPALLRRRPPPEPMALLKPRVLCFLAVFRTEFDALLAGVAYDPVTWLQTKVGGAALWEAFRNDRELAQLERQVADAMPASDLAEESEQFNAVWDRSVSAIFAAYDRARSIAGMPPAPR